MESVMSHSAIGSTRPYTRSRLIPKSSFTVSILVVLSACVTSTTKGYDGSMMQSLNELPSYKDYFGTFNPAIQAVNTCSIYFGGIVSAFVAGFVTNRFGRRCVLRYASVWTILAVIIQAAAQNVPMFVISRALVGFGITLSMIAGTAFVAETLPTDWRGWGVGLLGDLYYVGSLIAAGITYGTSHIESTWAWRTPSAIQALFSILALTVLFFVPESPRWLAAQGRREEALDVIAIMYSNGDASHPDTLKACQDISYAIDYERNIEEKTTFKKIVTTPDLRFRLVLVASASVCAMLSGNNVVSFYFGDMLSHAGITDSNTQLQITIILNAWCLVVSILGTYLLDRFGRKTIALTSNAGMVVMLFIIGALTAVYGSSTNISGIYGTVASIFLFQGVYSLAWTPLIMLYPPEILNYTMRAFGVGIMEGLGNSFGLMIAYGFPYAFAAIGWKFYMINAVWDIGQFIFVAVYWVETVGLTLEQIDDIFLCRRGKPRVIQGDKLDGEQEASTIEVTVQPKMD